MTHAPPAPSALPNHGSNRTLVLHPLSGALCSGGATAGVIFAPAPSSDPAHIRPDIRDSVSSFPHWGEGGGLGASKRHNWGIRWPLAASGNFSKTASRKAAKDESFLDRSRALFDIQFSVGTGGPLETPTLAKMKTQMSPVLHVTARPLEPSPAFRRRRRRREV